ncbi:peptidase M36 [Martensiomyces pterosporus]|nr:peptidase M36 [Martensiomyces pterosporus]
MVKCTFALGLLAASLASASIVSVAKDPQADVKVFTPSLPNEAKFNVYSDPVSVAAGAQPASFVGAASKDNGIKDKDVNYSGKGLGGDGVIANAQDGSGTNNANFATPPDGQRPKMRMYVFTQTTPNRDGDLEQDIVAHEFTHGISNRLTGGPANTNCLSTLEAGGMGEGWSDTVANLLRIKSGDTRSLNLIMGEYAFGQGIRNYPYSTSMTTNPETYAYINKSTYQEVHAIGEVWAEMLYEVIWNLIDAHGISADLFSHDLTTGNALALQLILDGMKLQPCSPTFITARNAIIQADQNLTGGANKCAIWKGFSKRGLGPNASGTSGSTKHKEDYSLPSGC